MAGKLVISTLNNDTGVLATQNGMTGIAKAWVQFIGNTAVINGSFNVSSVTRNSTGNYSVNFTTAMSNANYATNVNTSALATGGGSSVLLADAGPNLNSGGYNLASHCTTTFIRFQCGNAGTSVPSDTFLTCVAVFSS